MSLSAAVLDAMLAAGCTAEQVVAAVKASGADEEARAAHKREVSAARKRRQREKEAESHAMSRDVTRTDSDRAGQPLSSEVSPAPLPTNSTPKENTPLRGVQKKGERIPDDFAPDLAWAASQGLTETQAEAEAAKFFDYWRGKAGKDGVKLDWPATWRNWVRGAIDRLPQARGSPNPRPAPIDHFRNFASELNGQERDDRGPGGDWDDAPGVPIRTIEHHG